MATFGWTVADDDEGDSSDSGVLNCSKYTLSESGTADKMYARFDPNGVACPIRLAIWADNAGALGALKGATDEVTIPATGSPAWYEFVLSPSVPLTAADYHLGCLWGGVTGDCVLLFAGSGGPGNWYDDPFWTYHATNDPPDPGGSISLGVSGWAAEIYVNYTTGSTRTLTSDAVLGEVVSSGALDVENPPPGTYSGRYYKTLYGI